MQTDTNYTNIDARNLCSIYMLIYIVSHPILMLECLAHLSTQ